MSSNLSETTSSDAARNGTASLVTFVVEFREEVSHSIRKWSDIDFYIKN